MKLLDLFAGIGGFSLAAHWMGWETVAFVEKEAFCQKVLRKNFGPDTEIHDDIFTFSGKPFRGRVDVVTGGFPCQGQSLAGKREGKNDERYLFPQMFRVVDESRPNWVVAENVHGLLSIDDGRLFEEICSSLEGVGYAVQTFCVPASAVNAPHRRQRVWIVANAEGIRAHPGRRIISSPNGKVSERYNGAESSNADCNAPNAERIEGGSGLREVGTLEYRHFIGNGGRDASDTNTAGSNGTYNGNLRRRSSIDRNIGLRNEAIRHDWDEPWIEAATRLCRVDDGVSDRVHRLKALGNSIVPQIAFEIFRAIGAAEMES